MSSEKNMPDVPVMTGPALNLALNVLDFGADPTGVRDSSAAFKNVFRHIVDAVMPNPAAKAVGDRNLRGRIKLYIPEGCYRISQPEALLARLTVPPGRTLGMVIQGAGKGLTQIYYTNDKPGRYLMSNLDRWMGVTISDLEFVSDSAVNNFMYSYSEGGAQNYTFERCLWNGRWKQLFRLEGTNTNSEMTWYHCNFNGSILAGVYVPEDKGSDQFLNYNFFACHFEVDQGDFLVFGKGGNINVWGGSFIHYDNKKGGTFFKLLGGPHAMGVQRFLCVGARFEHRNANSRLIECEWNEGTVTFLSCDMSSLAYGQPAAVQAVFRSLNQKMPIVSFQSCMLMGKHEYRYGIQSWAFQHQVRYDNCEFAQAESAEQFIVYSSVDGHENSGGKPPIVFNGCRTLKGSFDAGFYDSNLGMHGSNRAMLTSKLISIKDAAGSFPAPGSSEQIRLPQGALILTVRIIGPEGSVDKPGAADYWIETGEPLPRRLASVFTASADQGFQVTETPYYMCDSQERCSIRLCAGPSSIYPNSTAYCLIEYIG
ncbi:hypothetical protein PghCCS26_38330 [Paenibacillus glycanilyticus]|uniref:Rhamnogalacturonase A/B/Epimerase-like pectate lyase domain-containing protein n=1 Tax=Paenibacillus glycanilyticus TaxID=126569 RepID=A0ABQ6NPI8_9BACL|nr:hypothetical protein PghCCS26_38330 [Paenibacillus glycanilyticus]